jgi:hypothetical protein
MRRSTANEVYALVIDWIEKMRAPRVRGELQVKTAIALVLLIAAAPASAQMLKCIGKDGKVEYATQCPPGTKEQQTGIRNEPGKITTPPQKSAVEREADYKKRKAESVEDKKKAEEKAAETAVTREQCDNARANLKGLQEGQRVVRLDPKTGERIFVQDEERPAEIARAQKAVDANCKS